MKLENYNDVSFNQIDVLREVGNIGMGNAATALSQMLGNKVEMSIPEVRLLTVNEAAGYLTVLQRTSMAITLELAQDLNGQIIHILRKSFAEKIINYFFPTSIDDIADIDEMSMSVISEVGNITSAAYVNAIASMTGLFIDISPPVPCQDMVQAVKNIGESDKFKCENKLMFINTTFYIDNDEIKSNLLFMPEINSLNLILNKLGVPGFEVQ